MKKFEKIAKLEQEVKELKSQMAHAYHFASKELDNCTQEKCMASGVILEISTLGGRELVQPVCIKDGLSDETIEAIKKDLKRSYELAIAYKL